MIINRLPLDRIRFFLVKLSDEKTNRSERFACWRLISSCALDEHEREVQEMNELNAIQSDPIITDAFGGVVG